MMQTSRITASSQTACLPPEASDDDGGTASASGIGEAEPTDRMRASCWVYFTSIRESRRWQPGRLAGRGRQEGTGAFHGRKRPHLTEKERALRLRENDKSSRRVWSWVRNRNSAAVIKQNTAFTFVGKDYQCTAVLCEGIIIEMAGKLRPACRWN